MSTNGKMQFPSREAGFSLTVSVRFTGIPLAHTSLHKVRVLPPALPGSPQDLYKEGQFLPCRSSDFCFSARGTDARTIGYW